MRDAKKRLLVVLPIIILVCLFECFGQYVLKKGREDGTHSKWKCVGIAALAYLMVCYLLYISYEHEGMGSVNLMMSSISILFATTVGVCIFGEHINMYGYLAILFAIMAIYFSYLNNKYKTKHESS
jgi:drug/metabolite transporter (DMT)-like permease